MRRAQRIFVILAVAVCAGFGGCSDDVTPTGAMRPESLDASRQNQVEFTTSMGRFVVQLYPDDAPITVRNFLDYVDQGFYHGLILHRIIDSFVVQGGAYTADMVRRPPGDPIVNEAGNGLSNVRGTISMARFAPINSQMGAVPTTSRAGFSDVPVTPIEIYSVRRVGRQRRPFSFPH
jgi:hypothetical protein